MTICVKTCEFLHFLEYSPTNILKIDFIDYYYISKHYTVWDLIEGARKKCRMDIDPWSLSTDFLSVEKFDSMPRMIKPLSLEQLKIFYRQKAKKLGLRQVEK
jgi:hypothetical protein